MSLPLRYEWKWEGDGGEGWRACWQGSDLCSAAMGARRASRRATGGDAGVALVTDHSDLVSIPQETDKASIDVEAQDEGLVAKIIVRPSPPPSLIPPR